MLINEVGHIYLEHLILLVIPYRHSSSPVNAILKLLIVCKARNWSTLAVTYPVSWCVYVNTSSCTLLFHSQVMFMRVTKEQITFNLRRWSIIHIALAFVSVLPAYIFVAGPPYLEFWHIICFVMSDIVAFLMAHIWISLTRSLSISARALNKCFMVSLCYTLHNIICPACKQILNSRRHIVFLILVLILISNLSLSINVNISPLNIIILRVYYI
jgi:hypothetical protein